MPRWKLLTNRAERTGEEGSASLEFITAGLILLLPLVYLILTMSAIQGSCVAAPAQVPATSVATPIAAPAVEVAERVEPLHDYSRRVHPASGRHCCRR